VIIIPPYLQYLSVNRSQNVRLGAGAGGHVPNEFDMGDTLTFPATGKLYHTFYADLNRGDIRRDIQRHSAIGALQSLGLGTAGKWSDLYSQQGGLAVTAGSGYGLNVSAGTITSRTFGGELAVPAVTGLTPALPSTYDRTDLVTVGSEGKVNIFQGSAATAITYEVDSVAITGTPTGGTFTLSFTFNGFNYTTAAIAYNASAATVATAVLAATGGPALYGTLTGTGGALPGAAVTLTASGALEGPITNQYINTSNLTGGTSVAGTFTSTTAGVGGTPPQFGGNDLPLAFVYIPATATSSSNYVITNIVSTS